jgi:hypothetical protein
MHKIRFTLIALSVEVTMILFAGVAGFPETRSVAASVRAGRARPGF